MTETEKMAFVRAYNNNVGVATEADTLKVLELLKANQYAGGIDGANSVLDALGVWHEAIAFSLSSNQ